MVKPTISFAFIRDFMAFRDLHPIMEPTTYLGTKQDTERHDDAPATYKSEY